MMGTNSSNCANEKRLDSFDVKQAQQVHQAQVAVQLNVARSIKSKTKKSVFEFDVNKSADVRITAMACIDVNRVLLCNNKGNALLIYSVTGEFRGIVSLSCPPYGVALLSDESEAVVSFQREKFIQFIDIASGNVKAGETISTHIETSGGISSFENKIILGMKNCIAIYNRNGKYIDIVSFPIGDIYSLQYFRNHVAYTNFDHFFITYHDDITKIKPLKPDETNWKPTSIASYRSDILYFTDFKNDRVIKMYPSSDAWTEFLSRQDGLYGPRAICFSKDFSKLIVANNDGQSIYIYSHS